MQTNVIHLNAALLPVFLKKLEKMNNRATKLGMPLCTATVGDVYEELRGRSSIKPLAGYIVMVSGRPQWAVNMVDVTVSGEAPRINGYEFIATVDLRGESPVVRAVPFTEGADLTPYWSTNCHCDHCNTDRRRNDVLVLREVDTGKMIQIGRNCAADFFRSADALQQLTVGENVFSSFANDDESGWPNVKADPSISLQALFTQAAAVVRTFGWVSTAQAERDALLSSTKSRVWANLFPWASMPVEDRAFPTEEDAAEAAEVIEWLMKEFVGKPEHARSDFERNVVAVIENKDEMPRARVRNLNFLIWAINGYKRELERRADIKAASARVQDSAYVGKIGDRMTLSLTLRFRKTFDSAYGLRAMCKFTDGNNNAVVWWGTSETAFDMILDEEYVVKATIKNHSVYNGINQTDITRVSVVEGKMMERAA